MLKSTFGKEAEGFIDTVDHPDFDKVFEAYAKVFTLESEFKPRKKLLQALARNQDIELQRKAGPCKEMWVYLKTPEGEIAGASNFDVFAGSTEPDIDGTLHGIFTFVNPKFRGKGVLPQLFRMREEKAGQFIHEVSPHAPQKLHVLSFVEQNSPPLMTPNEWDEDREATKTDPVTRREIFESQGYRQVGIRYIQPPLTKRGEPCNFLDLCVKGVEGDALPTRLLRSHLERYFALTMPEGTTLEHPTVKPMKDDLDRMGVTTPILAPGRFTEFGRLGGMRKVTTQLGAVIQLPEMHRDRPLGEIFPMAAQHFYGTELSTVEDVLPVANRRAAKEPDVLIIGAGIAGLKAAKTLRRQGISYRILEATGEAGGRAKTIYTGSGMPIDIAGHWGHNSKVNPLREVLERHDIPFTEDNIDSVYAYRDGKNHGGALRKDADSAIDWERANRIIRGEEPDCPLADLVADPDQRAVFARKYTTWYGLDHNDPPSALEYLTDEGTPGGFQVEGGIRRLIDVMARDARTEKNALFNTPVTKITHLTGGVKVEAANGKVFSAKKVIVTVPHAVIAKGNITINPPLSDDLQSDLQSIANGRMTKIVMELEPGFLESRHIPPDTHLFLTDSTPPLFCHLHGGGKPSIMMLVGGSKAEEIEAMPPEEAIDYVHANLAQVTELQGYREHMIGKPFISQANSDPYIGGAYSVCRPGAKRTGPRQEGNIFFAGETFDTRFPASMAGAYNSGKEAALMVAKALSKEKRKPNRKAPSHTNFAEQISRRENVHAELNTASL